MVLSKRAHRMDHVRQVPVSVSSNITGDLRSRDVLLIFSLYHKKYVYSSIPGYRLVLTRRHTVLYEHEWIALPLWI